LAILPAQAAHVTVYVFDAETGNTISYMLVVMELPHGPGGVHSSFTGRGDYDSGIARMWPPNKELEKGQKLIVNASEEYASMSDRQKAVHKKYRTASWIIKGVEPVDDYNVSTIYVAISPKDSEDSCTRSFMSRGSVSSLVAKMRQSPCSAHRQAAKQIQKYKDPGKLD